MNGIVSKIKFSIFLSILLYYTGYGQDCSCEKNLEWVKKTFEQNDAPNVCNKSNYVNAGNIFFIVKNLTLVAITYLVNANK
jgi:hypothetical protein